MPYRLGGRQHRQRIERVLLAAANHFPPRVMFQLPGVADETDAVARGHFRVGNLPNPDRSGE